MFGFLAERGNEPLALGNGEQETLALGTGQGEGEGAAVETEADKSAPPVQDAPPLPPGFVPPVPMGPPPPDAKKRDAEPALTPPEAIPNALDVNALDPMGIMSMDTSIEGLKKMAEQLQKQQDLFDAKSLEVMEMGAAVGAKSPMAPPLPAMPMSCVQSRGAPGREAISTISAMAVSSQDDFRQAIHLFIAHVYRILN